MANAEKKEGALHIIEQLRKAGFEALLAGGCVRDELRGEDPSDFDIATSATPDDIQALFEKTVPVGVQFGVILVIHEGAPYEVATFRTDGSYQDGRRPEGVEFATVEEDAKRRDFRVNGLYFDPKKNEVIDLVEGQKDLKNKIIQTIGDAKKRFTEDHLRMIRAIRFAVQLEFEIAPDVFGAIKELAPLIKKVSAERIQIELSKTLCSAQPARGVKLLDESGLLEHVLPEVLEMKGVEQPMEYHPEGDVYIHTLMLLEQLKNPPEELAWGALLHDISKPETFVRAPDRIRFHGHDTLGAEKSEKILRRLAFSKAKIDLICELVRDHLKFKDAKAMRESTLKRFIMRDHFDLHLELHRIDCLASHGDLAAHAFCLEKKKEFDQLPPPPLKLVTGKDLIELGFSPGREMGDIIRKVEDAILEGTVKTKEEGLAFVKKNFDPKG